jgi:hypothetical protein
LAGFGTSGSLLAGAAVLFVLGSAIVAFRGWPQIGTGPPTTDVSAPQLPSPSHLAGRVAAVLRTRLATGAGGGTSAAAFGRTKRGLAGVSTSAGTPSSGGAGAVSGASSAAAAARASGCAGNGCTQPGSRSVITRLTSSVAQEVTNIGSGVSSQVRSAAGTAAGAVSTASPQAGSSAQTVGDTAAKSVSGTASTAGSAVQSVGKSLGGGQ